MQRDLNGRFRERVGIDQTTDYVKDIGRRQAYDILHIN